MVNPKEKYYEKMLETLINDNNRNSAPFANENIWQALNKLMEETKVEFKRNINEITIDTSFQSPIKIYISINNQRFWIY